MTEPHEETDAAPPPTEAAEPVPPPAPPLAEPTVPPGTPVVPGWVAPEGGGGRSGWRNCCLIVAVLTAAFSVLAVVAIVGLIFLGSQVQSILAGTIQYGTGGTGCSVTGAATTFPSSVAIRSVAYLEHEVPAGTTVTTVATLADGTSTSTPETFAQTASCVTQAIDAGLPPGHYNLEYRLGTEVLATGGFDVTP